jgi:hypothetical protein
LDTYKPLYFIAQRGSIRVVVKRRRIIFLIYLQKNIYFTERRAKNKLQKQGFTVKAIFQLGLHEKDRLLLESIRAYFGGVGNITKLGKDTIQYRVNSTKDLKVIIDHFIKYPLITKKQADFELFKQIVEMLSRKEHLTREGLQQIVNLRASINDGLSDELKSAFPNTKQTSRPKVEFEGIPDPNWVSGFASAEACFLVNILSVGAINTGFYVQLKFQLTQHSRDRELMRYFIDYFGCGRFIEPADYNHGDYVVTKFSDITDKIVPFFGKCPLEGAKVLDFLDFCKVIEIVKNKVHLTESG